MSQSWERYTKRRRLDVVAWLRNKNIRTYAELRAECEKRSVVPPKHDAVKEFLETANIEQPKPSPRPTGRTVKSKPKPKAIHHIPPELLEQTNPKPKPKPKPEQVPKRHPAPKPVPKQPVKAPAPVRKKPEPKKSPAPMVQSVKSVPKPKPVVKEVEHVPEPAPAPIVKEPEKIVWNFMMRKGQLLELAHRAGIEGLSAKSTKAQIVGSLVKAGYPESQA